MCIRVVVTVTACSGTPVAPSDGGGPVKREGLEVLEKRRKDSIATPTCLKGLAAARISTVCLCLNIPTPTTTTTSIARTTSTSTTILSLLASTSTTAITGESFWTENQCSGDDSWCAPNHACLRETGTIHETSSLMHANVSLLLRYNYDYKCGHGSLGHDNCHHNHFYHHSSLYYDCRKLPGANSVW